MSNPYCCRRFGIIVFACLLIATFDSSVALAQRNDSRQSLFDYDRSTALDLTQVSSRDQDGVNIRDINYAALNPAQTDYLYYVRDPARNDGAHNFYSKSSDFEKGVRALREWEQTQGR